MTGASERMTAAEFRTVKAPSKNKFGAKKTVLDGITFDSAKEASRYRDLRTLERAGIISHLERQPKFELAIGDRPILIRSARYPNGRKASVRFDFAYWDGARRVIEDVKGGKATRTEAYALRKAIVEAMHPSIRVVEV